MSQALKNIKLPLAYLTWLPAIVPLAMILASFCLGGWTWGLIEDVSLISPQHSLWKRLHDFAWDISSGGRFNPTNGVHLAVFYRLFASSPGAFHIFHWFCVVLALFFWGLLASRVTRCKTALPLFFAIALSFPRLYDAFFYLSPAEIIGILFSGAAALAFFKMVEGNTSMPQRLAAAFLLVAAVLSKEPFVALALALGFSFFIYSFRHPARQELRWSAIAMIAAGILFCAFLKMYVVKDYSSDYGFTNVARITGNVLLWAKKPLLFHLPWIIAAALLYWRGRKPFSGTEQWALWFGGTLYLIYLLLLLPWSTWGHYATPLAVFFAFTMTVFMARMLEELAWPIWSAFLSCAFVFCVMTGSIEWRFHFTYQRDTENLVQWLSKNAIFQHDMELGAIVRANAYEPGDRIPEKVRMFHKKNLKNFTFTSSVGELMRDPQAVYYLWGPDWGDQDLGRLENMWTPVFVSQHWILFRRMY